MFNYARYAGQAVLDECPCLVGYTLDSVRVPAEGGIICRIRVGNKMGASLLEEVHAQNSQPPGPAILNESQRLGLSQE